MKNRQFGKTCLISAVLAAPLMAAVGTAGIADPQINKRVIANGGGSSVGASFQLNGTVGQPVTGQSSSANYRLQSGFWVGGAGEPKPEVIFEDGFEL